MKQNRMLKLALVVTVALASTALFAQTTVPALSGTTNVALTASFLSALNSLGVAPGVVYPTVLNGTTVNFPISSGAIDLTTAKGNLDHQGGLTLTAGGTTVTIQDFIIDTTGAAPVITGLATVNGALVGRITLFDLAFASGFTTPLKLSGGTFLSLSGIAVTLDPTAASVLNSVFSTSAFKGGLSIGKANVRGLFGGV
jgi:hypothetical protein